MAKPHSVFHCQQCGYGSARWVGRCPECGEFGSFVEESETVSISDPARVHAQPVPIDEVSSAQDERVATGIAEFDRVLGGGLVRGSVVLIGGEPGIGKSTLLLQAADSLARRGGRVIYVCGEESPRQIKLRADRLGVSGKGVELLAEVDVTAVVSVVEDRRPDLVVVDSIQTASDPGLAGVAGSVGQVRACTARLVRLAKERDTIIVVVGHVTKDGAIAGPRVLEHMVDTVLYFEGDRDHAFRVVRAAKNRFGSASEIGIFEMGEDGLVGVGQPSGTLLAERAHAPGSAVMAAVEGSRPLLVEVQALVTPSYLQMPRRLATGVDTGRLLQVLAVLERRAGMVFGQHDVYVAVAGGVRVTEPAVDLPLALAITSARLDVPVPVGLVAFGEVGLTGVVRRVPHRESRLREAGRMGFSAAVLAPSEGDGGTGVETREAGDIASAIRQAGLEPRSARVSDGRKDGVRSGER
ncbi:MAG: DNA repair protein RadA [Coriobacteriia bacterium]